MKHIKPYNESIRHLLKPKTGENIIGILNKMTPFGAKLKMVYSDLDEDEYITELIEKRIKESLDELDKLISEYDYEKLNDLVIKVSEWVEKNGGNPVNITDYGLKELSEHIVEYGVEQMMSNIVIYNENTFELFKQLLKNMSICEVKYNNTESNDFN